MLTFPTTVQLSQYDDTNLSPSTVVRVLTDPPDYFWRLDRYSTDVAGDGVTNTFSGVGRWLQYTSSISAATATFGSPASLVPGNANFAGISVQVPRADHVHGLPAFGTTVGTFAQGNDSRFTFPTSATALLGSILRADGAGASDWAPTIQLNDDDASYGTASPNPIVSAKRRVQTVNATPVVLYNAPIPTGFSGDLFVTVIACRSDGMTFISEIRYCYKNVAGVVTTVGGGVPVAMPPQPSGVTLGLALTINGTGVDVVGTGDASTWQWSAVCQTTFNRHT